MKVVVIGGGPSGMMSAISAAESGNEVILIEKMKMLGKKILITGKGRCNITSALSMDEVIKKVTCNNKFLYSSFKNFTNKDAVNFFYSQGLEVKVERGNRIFPATDSSLDVVNCFVKKLDELNVNIKLETKVKHIVVDKKINSAIGVKLENGEVINADKIILATGGKSYPITGATGDGYIMAEELGHNITTIRPSLVPLEIYQVDLCKEMQGLALKNVKIKMLDIKNNKLIYEEFGEMLFTHFGVSGPIILSGTADLIRYNNIEGLLSQRKVKLIIDLKPALDENKLDERVLRDFNEIKNKQYKNSLDKLLPKKMIPVFIKMSKIDPEKSINEITKKERKIIVNLLKNFELDVKAYRSIKEAIVTNGGINVKEINPKTMESKLIKNLYFAGEIIDVDAYTGGFNLQIAYSTGYTAGMN